jgi:hypothetical protein
MIWYDRYIGRMRLPSPDTPTGPVRPKVSWDTSEGRRAKTAMADQTMSHKGHVGLKRNTSRSCALSHWLRTTMNYRNCCSFVFSILPLTLYLMEMFVRCSHWLHPLWRVFEATFHMCPNFQRSFLRRSPIWTGSLAAIRPKRASWATESESWADCSQIFLQIFSGETVRQECGECKVLNMFKTHVVNNDYALPLSTTGQQAVQRPKLTKILPRVWLWWPGTAAKTWSFRSWDVWGHENARWTRVNGSSLFLESYEFMSTKRLLTSAELKHRGHGWTSYDMDIAT